MLSVTPFGLSGPYREFLATNLIVHALSGEMHQAGTDQLPPLKKGGNLADYHAGMHGFVGTLGALFVRHRSGRGQHVDVSHLTSLTSILGATLNGWLYDRRVSRRGDADPWSLGTAAQRGADGTRWGPSGLWQAQDGHVLAYGRKSADWEGLLRDMGGDLANSRFATTEGRDENVDELTGSFREWISNHTKQETFHLAQHNGHPYGYAAVASDLLHSPQLEARGFFVEIAHPKAGTLRYPGAPFIMGRTPFEFERAPKLGEHNSDVPQPRDEPPKNAAQAVPEPLSGKPLTGIKRGLTLDLQSDEGALNIRQLISRCDVVVENFSVGVMTRLGIDYDQCRAIRPDIVFLSMPAFGRTGPESGFVGMGATQEAMSGLLSITGHPGTLSNPTGVKYGDPNAGVLGAVAVLAALRHRQMTGEGQLIDLSQREANICTLPEIIFDYTMNDRTMQGHGNKHPDRAPRGCYRCLGEDLWIAIDVETDRQFEALCQTISRPDLAADPRFTDATGRKQHEDEIDAIIEDWTSMRESYQAMHALQQVGVPAGAVLTNQQVVEDPHFDAQEFFLKVDDPDAGTDVHAAPPWRFSETRLDVRRAPTLGQHNDYVLGEILGLTENEIEALQENKVIGTEPLRTVSRRMRHLG